MQKHNGTGRFYWQLHAFENLNIGQLYEILRLRQEVFVVEQACIYSDIDSVDQDAAHLLGIDKDDMQLLAYCRILEPGERYEEASIGRVLVRKTHRKRGLGRELMRRAIGHCERRFKGAPIRISAQQHLEAFYQSMGFETASKPYDEDGIPHIAMLYSFAESLIDLNS